MEKELIEKIKKCENEKDLFWDLFLTTGKIEAYLLLKDCEKED